ncbi:carbohydrate-binding protein [Rudanella paleaurantiibacter]|uniref:Carbohydrate-binding protein n=1 Tax=Rudanella paleaurantiibacter TaxID=2614655 RepID=A0A7J5TTA6_9BACT|nr:PQQ-dependent sugar dehydrogenase [Rudanella paleaurantiibacter]KAB7726871.1 carbohydrate-binding protein [Rudanella paleaurantiibacter]
MKKLLLLLSLVAGLAFIRPIDTPRPDDSRFTKVVLDNDLNEPMELAIDNQGILYYIERVGTLNRLDPRTGQKKQIAKLAVRATGEDGLLGLALDPNFATNRWLYLYYGDPTPRNGEYANVLARFELTPTGLTNRIEMLRVPLLHEGVSHSAGSLAFDKDGNLFLSTGDNTNPFESDGFGPFDDRPGRLRFDALKSSGNTNDLRGKILRIRPQPDGSYTIPTGNLFPPGTPQTRPEIYVMGCRNPFRIAIDSHTGFLYWGEVGPDAGNDSLRRGPRGHDEVNQARKPGNFGWPLFVGNNKPYHQFDFETKQAGAPFDPARPVNRSRNNTGLTELPPAQSAFIWYPYAESPEFPALGTGGRNAMAGPVYYAQDYPASPRRYPAYFDGKLFFYDWMRGWIFTAALHPNGDLNRIERFLPQMSFNHPVDMAFSPQGELYVLEYGSYWRAKNTDAALVRIEFNEGNRTPIARIGADKTVGAAPLRVQFSARESFDHDAGDSLRYEWFFGGKTVQSRQPNPTFTFTKPGTYLCRVRITDRQGLQAEAQLPVRVGNEPPMVQVLWKGNRSFFAPNSQVDYTVNIADREDRPADPKRVAVALYHLPEGEDVAGLMATGQRTPKGKTLIEQSDCRACHALNQQSVGPSWQAIARRYEPQRTDTKLVASLSNKIIQGGGGIWTKDHMMSAHPQLLGEDAAEMVRYILSLTEPSPNLPAKGRVSLTQPGGNYVVLARYVDRGGLTGQDLLRLYPTRFNAADAQRLDRVARRNGNGAPSSMNYNEKGSWIAFDKVDLTGLKSLKAGLSSPGLTGALEIRADRPDGPLLGQLAVVPGSNQQVSTALTPMSGPHDLYVVYREESGGINIWKRLELRWLEVGL